MPPLIVSDNFLKTIRSFNRLISLQAHEPVYLLFRKWNGPWISGAPSSYTYLDDYQRYAFTLWHPPAVAGRGRPRLKSLRLFLGGVEMSPVPTWSETTSDHDFWVELYMGGPKDSSSYGTQIVGFHSGFNPAGHTITFQFEEICTCIDVTEKSFHPNSRCLTCYGTGFVGGYDQYKAAPGVDCGRVVKPKNTILCRFPLASDVLKIGRYGAEITTSRKSWTTASPLLHDWDVIIRSFRFGSPVNVDPRTGSIVNERYWITEWEHSSARPSYELSQPAQPGAVAMSRGITLHQKFSTAEIQPNHIIYQIPFEA